MPTRFYSVTIILLVLIVAIPNQAAAVACSELFPDGLSNSQSTGSILIGPGGAVIDSPDAVLDTASLVDQAAPGTSCTTTSCTASNRVVPLVSYNNFPGTADVTVSDRETVSLPPGDYRALSVGSQATLRLSRGVYTFSGTFDVGRGARIALPNPGTARVYIQGAANIGDISAINQAGINHRLFFYTASTFAIGSSIEGGNVVIYAAGAVTVGNDAQLSGAITSAGSITLGNNAKMTFNQPRVRSTEMDSFFCEQGTVLNLIRVSGTSQNSTCAPSRIVITARDSNGETITDYTGTFTLSTSTGHGDWGLTGVSSDAQGALSVGAPDSGEAAYTFSPADKGTARLHLSNTHAESLTITVWDYGMSVRAISSALVFSENAFVVNSVDALSDGVVAGRPHAWRVRVVRKDPVTGVCGTATRYQQSTIKTWVSRSDSDPRGVAPQVVGSGAPVQAPEAAPAAPNLAINFTEGEAFFQLLTSDVGQYDVHFRDDSSQFSSLPILGSTLVTARPFAFAVSAVGNPGATDAEGPKFTAAGREFTLRVRAVGWQAADDLNGDGLPDGHLVSGGTRADLTNNPVLTGFGQETPRETVRLDAILLAPLNGRNPGLATAAGTQDAQFTSGEAIIDTAYFNEVGIIEVKAAITDGNYLGVAGASESRSPPIGRFHPDRFQFIEGGVDAACAAVLRYSYMGESFTGNASLRALGVRGGVTENYQGDFAKLAEAGISFHALDLAENTQLTHRVTRELQQAGWAAGVGQLDNSLWLERAPVPDGPYNLIDIGLSVRDSDGVGLDPVALDLDADLDGAPESVKIGQTRVRFGRLRLEESYGPETAPLPVVMLTEYWDGWTWRRNADDSCTTIGLGSVSYPDGPIHITANRTVSVGGGSTTGVYAHQAGGTIGFAQGDASHHFTAPGEGNTGTFSVNVNLADYPWLRFDWNNDGSHDDPLMPVRNYVFGMYRGHDRILYWQEILTPPKPQ